VSADDDRPFPDAPFTATSHRLDFKGRTSWHVNVATEHHRVQVAISPVGRSMRVYLDGMLMEEIPAEVEARQRGVR
jgi:hypothetical protein